MKRKSGIMESMVRRILDLETKVKKLEAENAKLRARLDRLVFQDE